MEEKPEFSDLSDQGERGEGRGGRGGREGEEREVRGNGRDKGDVRGGKERRGKGIRNSIQKFGVTVLYRALFIMFVNY